MESHGETLHRHWGGDGGPRRGFEVQGIDLAREGRIPQSQVLTKDVSWEEYQDAHDKRPQPVQSEVPVSHPGWGMEGWPLDMCSPVSEPQPQPRAHSGLPSSGSLPVLPRMQGTTGSCMRE